MSIQDESFPDDEFVNILDFSSYNSKRFQFPNYRQRQSKYTQQEQERQLTPPNPPLAEEIELKPVTTTNTSPTSSAASSSEQNVSTESTNGRAPSVMSSKTTASDPTGLADHVTKKSPNFHEDHAETKAGSYQDIHSEYTKRRYKHVESKVGKYIASLKAEDEKRRKLSTFQRHRSMPAILGNTRNDIYIETTARNVTRKAALLRYDVTNELHKLSECASYAEEHAESSENTSDPTTSSSNGLTRHDECSDDANVDFIDRLTYAQLVHENERIQSYSDYLQTKLDEKMGEIMRLKRNVEFMRIELTNCKDKLKRQINMSGIQNMSGSGSLGSLFGNTGRHSLQPMLYCATKSSKATQTELKSPTPEPPSPPPPPPPSPSPLQQVHEIYITPSTQDLNNNDTVLESGAELNAMSTMAASTLANCRGGKNVATIQPIPLNFSSLIEPESGGGERKPSSRSVKGVLRQRSNSNSAAKPLAPPPPPATIRCNPRRNFPTSSNDSAIEVETVEPFSPEPSLFKIFSPRAPARRGHQSEFIYYDKHSGRYATLQTLSATGSYDENDAVILSGVTDNTNASSSASFSGSTGGRDKKASKKYNSLRRRWLRLFGQCARCNDPNQTLDGSSAPHQNSTQIPLLEKSVGNHCRNLR